MPRAITIALAAVLAAPVAATLADLEALMEKQEGLVLELASEVEQQHRLRCGLTVSDCQEMSYDNCGTRYPCQTCPADGLDIAACGTGKGGLFDYTVSSVRLAGTADTDADNNPSLQIPLIRGIWPALYRARMMELLGKLGKHMIIYTAGFF